MNNFALRKIVVFFAYGAIALVAIGMLADKFKGTNKYAYLNMDSGSAWQDAESNLQILPLKFETDYYPPDYALYKPVYTSVTSNAGQTITESIDYELITQVRPHKDGSIKCGKYGSLETGALLNNTQWVSQAVLPGGFLLQALERPEKNYTFLMSISSGKEPKTFTINVNKPAKCNNRLIHLVSFDKSSRTVILKIRYAPGRLLARSGFFLLIGCSIILSVSRGNYADTC